MNERRPSGRGQARRRGLDRTGATGLARIVTVASGLALVIGGFGAAVAWAAESEPTVIYRGVSTALRFDVSPPVTELARRPSTGVSAGEFERDSDRPTGREGPLGPRGIDLRVQRTVGSGEIPAPNVSFDALTGMGPVPPDPVGAVGPNHYVAMGNTQYAIYSKTGALLAGPANINTLWSGFGGPCQDENGGDPIVLYDRQADRWLLTQLTSAGPTYFNCVALSQTGDPTGSYFRWAFSTGGNLPDYPKYGHWPDAYYISAREFSGGAGFSGVAAYALNRTQMLAGDPTPQVISFLATPGAMPYTVGDGLLPTDLDGTTPPPAGTPNFYIGSQDDGGPYGAPSDALNIWKFHVDFVTPENSTFTLANTVAVGAFDSIFPCSPGSRDCIPQPGTSRKIDHLGYRQRPLHRAAYRNFGTHESIVTNQSVEASPGISGIRWWEIRSPNSDPTIYQEGTYAPGVTDGIHRWMGSIAQDQHGNMALGFSASNTAVFPSVWYTGRLAGDAPGTMGQGEGSIIDGAGSQLSPGARWGDYTAMTVDPADDCTFWYVNEYYPATSISGWRLRVGAFKFPSCGSPGPALAAAVLPTSRSVMVGTPATAFATMIAAGPGTALQCFIAPLTSVPATFHYQTTNPATNQVTGTPDTPVDLPGGGQQSFVVAFTPTGAFAPTDVQLTFTCANTAPAPVVSGVTTLLLSASTLPVPDIVALGATLNSDGIVNIPGSEGTGVFAVATVNVGASASITASADTGAASLPVSLSLCQTNPVTGACLAPPAGSVTTQINATATPTFGIFVMGAGPVPFDPANNRVFVRFKDAGSVTRGATSVAVRTQ